MHSDFQHKNPLICLPHNSVLHHRNYSDLYERQIAKVSSNKRHHILIRVIYFAEDFLTVILPTTGKKPILFNDFFVLK